MAVNWLKRGQGAVSFIACGSGNSVVLLGNHLAMPTSIKIHVIGLEMLLLGSYPIETPTQHLRTYKERLSNNTVHSGGTYSGSNLNNH